MPRMIVFLVLVLISVSTLDAQEASDAGTALSRETIDRFAQLRSDIELAKRDIARLDRLIDESEGVWIEILNTRRDTLWTTMFRTSLELARAVARERDDGDDVTAYLADIRAELVSLPAEAYAAIERMSGRIEIPESDLDADRFVLADQELFRDAGNQDAIYKAMVDYIEVARQFDIDAGDEVDFVTLQLADIAANRSIFLEIALNDVDELRAAVATLPDDGSLKARLAAAERRVQSTAGALQDTVMLMNAMDLETRQYRQQILTATGEITTDVLDVRIITNLISEWSRALGKLVISEGPKLVLRVLLFVLILFVVLRVSRLVQKGVARALDPHKVSMSRLLRRMLVSTARNTVIIIGFLFALSQIGIALGPLLTGLGIAGFIIGFALQDSLSNLASGMMILINRPFDVGDFVEAGGIKGKVSRMSLVNTTFMTFDNQKLVVPNNLIWKSVITNFTDQDTRRVDLVFDISYSDDIEKAERILSEVLAGCDTILEEPEPAIRLHELGESSVKFIVRPWVKTEDYWPTYWELTRAVKFAFDREGITIPFPQRDVHVIERQPA